MKTLSSKKEARIEKKKKKVTALARLVQLNQSEETMVAKEVSYLNFYLSDSKSGELLTFRDSNLYQRNL